ncbi:MAG: M16 family metallopeptidase, partial [Christensenellales bacterium]
MITTKVMPSGVRVAVNSMKGFEGVSFKMFVFTGSSNESDPKDYGISHLIEHMFFKGTKTRTSFDIVKEFDDFGIQSNAYTSKTETCYFTYGTGESLEKSVEIMSDMLFNSTFDETELKREKEVVIEELKMYQDRPDAVCEIVMDSVFFEGTNYAHDIVGTKKSVRDISREQIFDYFKKRYVPKNIVLSFAGNVDDKKATALVEKYFEPHFKKGEDFVFAPTKSDFEIAKKQKLVVKETNQAQIAIAFKTENRYDREKLPQNVLISQMLGGSMGSRLFQEIREKLGLVYTISTFNDATELAGMFSINFGTSLNKVELALQTIKKVLNEVCN